MNAMRGTLYLSACRQTVSDCGWTPRDGVEDGDRAVEDAQAALHLHREVHVPGRIDDVDAMVAPERRRRRGRDRDAALLLLRHPVHRRGALVHLAHLVGAAGVVEDALGRRRLARVDVGHDPDVPDAVERDVVSLRASCSRVPFPRLPAVVREGLVGLRHPVDVVLALERAALLVERVQNLAGELVAPCPSRAGRARTSRASARRACGRGAAAPRPAPGSSRRRRGGRAPRAPA